MSKNDRISRRSMLKTAAFDASSIGEIAPNEGHAATPKTAATQVTGKHISPDYPRFRGPFSTLSTPCTDSGAVDFEVRVTSGFTTQKPAAVKAAGGSRSRGCSKCQRYHPRR